MQLSFLAPPTQYLDYFLTGIQRVNLRSEANSSTNYLNPLILASLSQRVMYNTNVSRYRTMESQNTLYIALKSKQQSYAYSSYAYTYIIDLPPQPFLIVVPPCVFGRAKIPYDPVCVPVWLVGREVSLPCSSRSTFFLFDNLL